jgi:hypothetical protein
MIKKFANKWALHTKDGKKILGIHPTKEAAQKQEEAIEISKHKDDAGATQPKKK